MAIATSLSDMAGRRVLVTGASGFLGINLCQRLGALGARVHGASRHAPPGHNNATWFWECADLCDEAVARSLLEKVKPDVIFHLSGYGFGAPDLHNVLPTFKNDLMTAVNILTFSTELQIGRIVLAASLEEPSEQDADLPPASPYAAAKWSTTMYSRMFHFLYGTPVVALRLFMTYGPAQKPHKLIPYVILSLLRGEAPKLSSGRRDVDWVYVDDVIDGMLAAATARGVEGKCFDIGSGELASIRQLVEMLVAIIRPSVQPQFAALPDRPAERERVASLAESAACLGWRPNTKLQDGLRRTVEWYQKDLARSLPQGTAT